MKYFFPKDKVKIMGYSDITGAISSTYIESGCPKANVYIGNLFKDSAEDIKKRYILDGRIYISTIVCDYSSIEKIF